MDEDRVKWDQRYRDGDYGSRRHPTALLEEWLDRLPTGSALDVACGNGRNARFLAPTRTRVVGVDISAVAIQQARELAADLTNLEFVVANLDDGLPITESFDLIVMVRFVDLHLMRSLSDFLNPGGAVLIEQHLVWDDPDIELAGPGEDSRFRTKPGDVAGALKNMHALYSYEGLITDPLGETSAVAQFIGTKR